MRAPRDNPRLMSLTDLRRRMVLAVTTRQPCLHTFERLTGMDKHQLKSYAKGTQPYYDHRLILSDFFRKLDLGIYELYQRPFKRGKGMVWDIRVSDDPRPPVSACVTLSANGPKLRFKTNAELLGQNAWPHRNESELRSSKRIGFSRNSVV